MSLVSSLKKASGSLQDFKQKASSAGTAAKNLGSAGQKGAGQLKTLKSASQSTEKELKDLKSAADKAEKSVAKAGKTGTTAG
ncbi:phage tail protein, partial [Streptomyces sp. TRM76130]|nr:phage tail protein [Streptomyces sp. TRM76130]